MIVADYSAGFPGARALKEAGFSGAVRYIGFTKNVKCTNAGELKDFTANGLGMALVFEHAADDWRGGWEAGYANYVAARLHADAIGFPSHRPIYMAVDSEVVGNDAHKLMQSYLVGARDAAGGDPYQVGVYGQYSVCQWLHDVGNIVGWYWQCRAWSGTPIKYFTKRHLFQRVATVTISQIPSDINDVSQDDWGQHTSGHEIVNEEEDYMTKIVKSDQGPEHYVLTFGPGTKVTKDHIPSEDILNLLLRLRGESVDDVEVRTQADLDYIANLG